MKYLFHRLRPRRNKFDVYLQNNLFLFYVIDVNIKTNVFGIKTKLTMLMFYILTGESGFLIQRKRRD
mgnify:CR=1 FL=1